jgi:hypothetical protein
MRRNGRCRDCLVDQVNSRLGWEADYQLTDEDPQKPAIRLMARLGRKPPVSSRAPNSEKRTLILGSRFAELHADLQTGAASPRATTDAHTFFSALCIATAVALYLKECVLSLACM